MKLPPPRKLARRCFAAAIAMLAPLTQANTSDLNNPTELSAATSATTAVQPSANARQPITDATGRVRYIVDLIDDEIGKPAQFNDADAKIKYHKDKSDKLISEVAKIRGVELLSTTSLVGISFVAYLDAKQVDQIAKDKRVALMTQDAYLKPSALWNNITENFGGNMQVRPWGLQAMGLTYAGSSNGSAIVYVLDNGVGIHTDLPGLSAANQLSALPGVIPVGCYGHGAHVAGIIGASSDNYIGVVGALPGVKLVSVAMGNTNFAGCSGPPTAADEYPLSGFTQGLDTIYFRVLQSGKVGIVNLSYNGLTDFAATATIGSKMKALATPSSFYAGSYKGSLVVQSAGNQGGDACTYSYNAPSSYDGILVVGGLDENGQVVVPLNRTFLLLPDGTSPDGGYRNGGDSGELGSNFGGCVEVWAPSQRISSTWRGGGYQVLSGTSMAAPYVTGFAARLLESDPSIATSQALESAVRARLITIAGSNLKMPHLLGASFSAVPTIEVWESGTHYPSSPLNFSKFPLEISLKVEAAGANTCSVSVAQGGYPYASYAIASSSSVNLNAHLLPAGDYVWTVTCTSSVNTQSVFVINGHIKQKITAAWEARTASTGAMARGSEWCHRGLGHGRI